VIREPLDAEAMAEDKAMLKTGRAIRALAALFAALCMLWAASGQAQLAADSRLTSITARKAIRIAYRTDARPFSFLDGGNAPLGYTIDLCKPVVQSIAQQFGLQELKIQWVAVTVDTRFSAIADGKADMECGASTVTLGRMKEVDFSNLVFLESTGIVVAQSSNIHSFADMAGRKIAVIAGTTNASAMAEQIRRQSVDATLILVKDREEGISFLEARRADGFASDKLLLTGAKFKSGKAFVVLPDDLSVEQYAIALPRGDSALRLAVNTGLAQIFRSGQAGDVFQRWFFGLRPGPLMQTVYALGSLAD
jgi:glutamate/aspartate transport system substrate-binding protein